jgi:hypothetical protein
MKHKLIPLHPSITPERIEQTAWRNVTSMDNIGICRACGQDQYGCEPDAACYECEHCGENEVYGIDMYL